MYRIHCYLLVTVYRIHCYWFSVQNTLVTVYRMPLKTKFKQQQRRQSMEESNLLRCNWMPSLEDTSAQIADCKFNSSEQNNLGQHPAKLWTLSTDENVYFAMNILTSYKLYQRPLILNNLQWITPHFAREGKDPPPKKKK